MAEQAWQPNEEQMALLREVIQKTFDFYEANITEEQRAKTQEKMIKYKAGDQEFIAELMGKMTAAFQEADANGDGRLDADESRTFYGRLQANAAEGGEFG